MLMLRSSQKAFQTREMNLGPQLEAVSSGSLKKQNTKWKRALVVSRAEGSLRRGMRQQALENLTDDY